MAALIKHGIHIRSCFILSCGSISQMPRKFISSQSEDFPATTRLKDTHASISSKGFLRSYKPYVPPEDVTSKLNSIINSTFGGTVDVNKNIENSADKFKLLEACCKEFSHSVPNSLLHTMETLGDIIQFYKTPVVTTTPLDQLKSIDLPPNLHVQYEYHRFHPEEDVMFGGLSAFPKSSTIVTGLKYKKKYRGHEAKKSWP